MAYPTLQALQDGDSARAEADERIFQYEGKRVAAHQTIAGCTNRKVTLLAQAAADGNADFVGSGAQPSLLPGGGSARCAWPAARTNANQAFVAPAWSGDEWRIRALIEGASDPVAVIS